MQLSIFERRTVPSSILTNLANDCVIVSGQSAKYKTHQMLKTGQSPNILPVKFSCYTVRSRRPCIGNYYEHCMAASCELPAVYPCLSTNTETQGSLHVNTKRQTNHPMHSFHKSLSMHSGPFKSLSTHCAVDWLHCS